MTGGLRADFLAHAGPVPAPARGRGWIGIAAAALALAVYVGGLVVLDVTPARIVAR